MNNKADYEFSWWDDSYNDEYVTSDETLVAHSNKKLGVIDSPQTSLKHYLYCNPETASTDNIFHAMDVRRSNLKQTISQAIKPSYTTKQRTYIEWYYITRGLPIAAHPSEEVQREFDRYYVLSSGYRWSYETVKYVPKGYDTIVDHIKESVRNEAAMLEIADYYCSWFTCQDIPSIRSLYCHSWNGPTYVCIRNQIKGVKSLKLTKYIDLCISDDIWDIDEIIQPSLGMMISLEQYLLKTAKYKEYLIVDDAGKDNPIHIYNDDKKRIHCESDIYNVQEMYGSLRFASIYFFGDLIVMDPYELNNFDINISSDNINDIIDIPLDEIPDKVSSMVSTYIKRWEYDDVDNRKYLANLIGRIFNTILLILLEHDDNNTMDKTLDVLNKALDTISKIECYDTSHSRDPVKYTFVSYIHRGIRLIEDRKRLNN